MYFSLDDGRHLARRTRAEDGEREYGRELHAQLSSRPKRDRSIPKFVSFLALDPGGVKPLYRYGGDFLKAG